jgi:hypothetical protein
MQTEAYKILSDSTNDVKIDVKQKYNPIVFITDQTIRIFILYLYLHYQFSAWFFLGFNIVLSIAEASLNTKKGENVAKYYKEFLKPEFKKFKIKISIESSVPDYLINIFSLLGLIFTYWFLYYATGYRSWYSHIFFLIVSFAGAFLFLMTIFLTDWPGKKRTVREYKVLNTNNNKTTNVTKHFPGILNNLNIVQGPESIPLDPVDYNDTQIAKLESKIKSSTTKVDAYLLESVLLGGLAFSGFLTVVSSNILNRETTIFNTFCSNLRTFKSQIQSVSQLASGEVLHKYFHREDLFILIMLLCLFSSVFFLLVLTLRMRFMRLSLEMDHLVRIITIFNAKEEELTNIHLGADTELKESLKIRLKKITKKIDFALSDANKLMTDLIPIVRMMSICRNLGVFIFYIVLIVSGFYFSPIVAYGILMIAVLLFVVRWSETIIKEGKIKNLLSRHK